MFTNDKQDDVEMLRQLRLLYMRSNKIIRMFFWYKYLGIIVDYDLNLIDHIIYARIRLFNGLWIVLCMKMEIN